MKAKTKKNSMLQKTVLLCGLVVIIVILVATYGATYIFKSGSSSQKTETGVQHYYTSDGATEISQNQMIPGGQYIIKIVTGNKVTSQFTFNCPTAAEKSAATTTPEPAAFVDPLDNIIKSINLSEEQKQALIEIYTSDFTKIKSEIETARKKLKDEYDANVAALKQALADGTKEIDDNQDLDANEKSLEKSNLNVKFNADMANLTLKFLESLQKIASNNSQSVASLQQKFIKTEWFNGCKLVQNADPNIQTIKVYLSRYQTNVNEAIKNRFPGVDITVYTVYIIADSCEGTAINKGTAAFDLKTKLDDGVTDQTLTLPIPQEGMETSVKIKRQKEYEFCLGDLNTEVLIFKPNSQSPVQVTSQSYQPKPTPVSSTKKSGDTISESEIPQGWVIQNLSINNTQRRVAVPESKWNEIVTVSCDITKAIVINNNSQIKFTGGSAIKITDFYFVVQN